MAPAGGTEVKGGERSPGRRKKSKKMTSQGGQEAVDDAVQEVFFLFPLIHDGCSFPSPTLPTKKGN